MPYRGNALPRFQNNLSFQSSKVKKSKKEYPEKRIIQGHESYVDASAAPAVTGRSLSLSSYGAAAQREPSPPHS